MEEETHDENAKMLEVIAVLGCPDGVETWAEAMEYLRRVLRTGCIFAQALCDYDHERKEPPWALVNVAYMVFNGYDYPRLPE